jgi:ceramide glucosyltransferase
MTALADLFAALAALGALQCLAGLIAVWFFAARSNEMARNLPPVTVLKPLCGDEPFLDEALASCCLQDYPSFQIVFGVQDSADPAIDAVRRLQSRFPDRDISLVIDSTPHGPNRKVGNLINMLPSAKHDILVISDSDLHLSPNYLERLVAQLEKPGTGLVTTLYVGFAAVRRSWAARLGATQITHGFLPGVLLSRALGRQDCLGSTAMFTRNTLARIGGLFALVELLAEDNVMGQRVLALGLSVRLASIVPAATVPEADFRSMWRHEIRWTRTISKLAPVAIAASSIQYPLFWALAAVCLSGGAPWAVSLFAVTWIVRAVTTRGIDFALKPLVGRPVLPTPFWLLPVRDILTVVEIAFSYWVGEVMWRGHKIGANCSAKMPVTFPAPEQLHQEV